MSCIYEPVTFSRFSPKHHRLHMTPIAGCSVAAGRLKRDWKFSAGVFRCCGGLTPTTDAYSSITNISSLYFCLSNSSTSSESTAPTGLSGCLLTSVWLLSNISILLQGLPWSSAASPYLKHRNQPPEVPLKSQPKPQDSWQRHTEP